MSNVFQSLWIGPTLSKMEVLSINSYLRNGHEFHLYIYDYISNVPEGVMVRDANEIIPRSEIFSVRGGYSSFSDFFRWKVVLMNGGWWTDLDAVCLKPFDFTDDYVFVGGLGPVGSDNCVSSGIFKAPAYSDVMIRGWNRCLEMDPATMTWGQAGPPLFTELVHKFNLTSHIIPGKLFFPVFYSGAPAVFLEPNAPEISEEAYSVHLFNEMWRLAGQDKDGVYPPTCLYERLVR